MCLFQLGYEGIWVIDGDRTHVYLNHNQVLYRLATITILLKWKDSNPHYRRQKPMCYHYTTLQSSTPDQIWTGDFAVKGRWLRPLVDGSSCLDGKIRTCVILLPKQVRGLYATSRNKKSPPELEGSEWIYVIANIITYTKGAFWIRGEVPVVALNVYVMLFYS